MATPRARRFVELPPDRFAPDGSKLCCWCGGPLKSKRQRWCSQACVDDYLCRASQAGARKAAWKRDRGRCAACGTNTARVERILNLLSGIVTVPIASERVSVERVSFGIVERDWEYRTTPHPSAARRREQLELAVALVNLWAGSVVAGWYGGRCCSVRSLWEADHTVPLIEGGAPGPENVRTLCLPCHKGATRALAARLAEARRPQMKLGL